MYSKCGVSPRTTQPRATIASYFFDRAACFTANGISNDPGTRITRTCFWSFSARVAPAISRSIITELYSLATIANRYKNHIPLVAIEQVDAKILLPRMRLWLKQRFRVCGIAVVVEPPAGFLAVMASQDKALQQRRGREPFFTEFFKHDVGDVVSGLQTHKIQKREWSHRITASQFHSFIDVC